MNLRTALAIAALTVVAVVPAQLSKDKMAKSRDILMKSRAMDHLVHLLPLALTKDQYGKLLPVIEKARAKEDDITVREYNDMLKIEPIIDAEILRGTKNGAVPSKQALEQVAKLYTAFSMRRVAAAEENVADILAAMKTIFNAGQLKVASNTIDPKVYDPNAKPDKMSEDEKIKYFIRAVILDWSSYDILVKLAAK